MTLKQTKHTRGTHYLSRAQGVLSEDTETNQAHSLPVKGIGNVMSE
jgi:hypothetical protein